MSALRTLVPLTILVAVVTFGCSTERPTRPGPIAKLPATPISSPLVVDNSESMGGVLHEDSTYVFDLGSAELFRTATFDDISISFLACRTIESGTMKIFNHGTSTWEELKGAFPVYQSDKPSCDASSRRLVSQFEGSVPRDFLNWAGGLSLRTSVAGQVRVRLLQYSDDYHFATVRNEFAQHASLWYANSSLYAVIGDGFNDSLIAFDLEGMRRWAIECEPHRDAKSAYDGTYVWTQAPVENRLIQMDTLGHVIASIVSNLGFINAFAWANGSLWCVGETDNVFQIDVDSSLARDTVVARSRFAVQPFLLYRRMTADSIGPIFGGIIPGPGMFTQRIYRHTFQGALRDAFDYEPLIWAIAWDGESLWALHMGPPGALTNAKLLTRFSLE